MFEMNREFSLEEASYDPPDNPPTEINGWIWVIVLVVAFSTVAVIAKGCEGRLQTTTVSSPH